MAGTLPSPSVTQITIGGSAVTGVGNAAGQVAAGNDARIVGATQKASNLSDVANPATALGNLGGVTSAQAVAAVTTMLTGLPTSLPATAGQLWNDGGVLSVS